jgi:hypothetical protein
MLMNSRSHKGIYCSQDWELGLINIVLGLGNKGDISMLQKGRSHQGLCSQAWELGRWKVPARLHWDLLTSRRYRPPCHYF